MLNLSSPHEVVRAADECRRRIDKAQVLTRTLRHKVVQGEPVMEHPVLGPMAARYVDAGVLVRNRDGTVALNRAIPKSVGQIMLFCERREVEMRAVEELSCDRVCAQVRAELQRSNDRLAVLARAASRSSQWKAHLEGFVDTDIELHLLSVHLGHAGNPPQQYVRYMEAHRLVMQSGLQGVEDLYDTLRGHQRIIDAIERKDPFSATSALEEHLCYGLLRWNGRFDFKYSITVERRSCSDYQPPDVPEETRGESERLEPPPEIWDDDFYNHPGTD